MESIRDLELWIDGGSAMRLEDAGLQFYYMNYLYAAPTMKLTKISNLIFYYIATARQCC